MVDDLKMIKKYYGEDMMHLCRELFPTILEIPGLMFSLLDDNFEHNHCLCEDIVNEHLEIQFKNYIYSLMDDYPQEEIQVTKSPYELMDEVGYTLFECKSEEDIQRFKKYYANGEELCTFRGGRLNNCHVFFAVKKNVDEIKRKDYKNPERQDEYGTSVISIQFTRGEVNTLSIKNRYNHRVKNPDATFSNNLDNIILGLTDSFEKTYGLNINQNKYHDFEIPGYVQAEDGKYYKYNYEIDNIYYCPDNLIIINYVVNRDYQEKEKYLIVDYFIIDLVNKKVELYDKFLSDSFVRKFKNIKKIEVTKVKENGNKIIIITPDEGSEIIIEIDKLNRMISYKNENLEKVGNEYLCFNRYLRRIDLPNVKEVERNFLRINENLEMLNMPNVVRIGESFLYLNNSLEELNLPNLMSVEYGFLYSNNRIITLDLPNLISVEDCFLYNNNSLIRVNLPSLRVVGGGFLLNNKTLKELFADKLEYVKSSFLSSNNSMEKLNLPSLISVGMGFMMLNNSLIDLKLPHLISVESCFLSMNNSLVEIELPNLISVGVDFLPNNETLKNIYFPLLVNAGDGFLTKNKGRNRLIRDVKRRKRVNSVIR